MNQSYGPWATQISAVQNPQLSAFWRRRMGMLASVSKASPALSRQTVVLLVVAAIVLLIMPTFSAAPAAAQRQADATKEKAASTSDGKTAANFPTRDTIVVDGQTLEVYSPFPIALPRPFLFFLTDQSLQKEAGFTAEQKKKLQELSGYYIKESEKWGKVLPPWAVWTPEQKKKSLKEYARVYGEIRHKVVAMLTREQRDACCKVIRRDIAYYASMDSSIFSESLGVTSQQWEKVGQFRLAWDEETVRRPLDATMAALTAQQWEKLMTRAENEYRKSHEPAAGDPPIDCESPPQGWLYYFGAAEIDDDNDSLFIVLPIYEPLRYSRVQQQLETSDDQRARLQKIARRCLTEFRRLHSEHPGKQSPDENKKSQIAFQREALRFTKEIRPEIEALFTPGQLAELKKLVLWPLAAAPLATPQVQNELGLTDAQKAALARIEKEKLARPASFPAEMTKTVLGALSPEQRAKLFAEIDHCFE
jgi:hypothetical protein